MVSVSFHNAVDLCTPTQPFRCVLCILGCVAIHNLANVTKLKITPGVSLEYYNYTSTVCFETKQKLSASLDG